MTPEDRLFHNEQTMDGSRDRTFCGIELLPVTAANRRYIERLMAQFIHMGYGTKETAYGYAFILTLSMDALRPLARNIDQFEKALDAFISTLPDPVPKAENDNLETLIIKDIEEIKAAEVNIEPKPGEAKTEGPSDPNE